MFEYGFSEGGHRPYLLTKPVAIWLEKHLDFPNWTEASIRKMPVSLIFEWASENGAEIDPGYSSNFRAGGTQALGNGVPALSRKDLSVFSEDQWEIEKNSFIYESWSEAARAEV